MMDALLQNRRDSKAQEKPDGEQESTIVGTAGIYAVFPSSEISCGGGGVA